ncbi:MAG: glutaredoxin family protein [Methanomicrobiales archaeon]|nr:glutaredoxin family protein [Methanomicrobiales archaeon]
MLKDFLQKNGIFFQEENMAAAGPLTELRIHGVFVREAPVLQIGEVFLTSTDLFRDGEVREDIIQGKLTGDRR